MDCGIPFCQSGCPVHNIIPDWNDLVYRHQWREALDVLHSTNNFPEFTGRICPAPCEEACTLNINDDPVGIKSIEHFIIDKGWEEGWVVAAAACAKTGKRVAVVGSGPAGMACAQQLARAGHDVVLFEKADRIGGLLRYGIPDFKMEKHLIDRRMAQMSIEGVEFRPNANVGVDVRPRRNCSRDFDAVVADGRRRGAARPAGARPRSRRHPFRDGLPAAAEQGRRRRHGSRIRSARRASTSSSSAAATRGSDCVGTSNRHGAASITQFELLPQPPEPENKPLVWPNWPIKLRTSSSHEEGCERDWAVADQAIRRPQRQGRKARRRRASNGRRTARAPKMVEVPGSEFEIKADLVLLAMGFVGPTQAGLLAQLGVERDARVQRQGRYRELPDVGAQGLRRRRHAPRAVARRVGDPRGTPVPRARSMNS